MTAELEDGTPPEWMVALENKKRHHKLAHEIGAGAPCLNCNDRCLGLDLHFWRKICRNCKCKKEVHDVKEENSFEQFEILFGDNLKSSDRGSLDFKCKLDDIRVFATKETHTKDANSHFKTENALMFDWIPADIPIILASEYLQQLPLEMLPITGSAGAMFRRQQLQKQMPLHDFKVNNCHELTDEETRAFSEYVDNLKTNAVGKGQITKILPSPANPTNNSYSLNFPTLSNNLNSTPKPFRCFSKNKTEVHDLPCLSNELLYPSIELKTPSAFIPMHKKLKDNFSITNANEKENNKNGGYERYELGRSTVDDLATEYVQKLNVDKKILDVENNNLALLNKTLTPADINLKFSARQSPVTTTLSREADVKYDVIRTPNRYCEKSTSYPSKNEFITLNRNVSPYRDVYLPDITAAAKNIDGKFLKLGTPEQFIALSSYVSNKPQLANTLTSVTKDKDRNQNPKVHFDGTTTMYLDDDIIDPQQVCALPCATAATMNSDSMCVENNMEIKCHQCKLAIYPGQVVVVAERAGVEVIWHPQCFVCVICQELLVDLVYFFHRGEVYCGRHYAEVLKIPRCLACDELIFLKEYTVAEGQSFHVKHFCCFECDIPLAGKSYVPKDNNPICLPCYESKYGKRCSYCAEMIKAGDSRVGWEELSWHATAYCFKCVQCLKSLLGGKFVVRNNEPLCSKECIVKYDLSSH